MAKTDKELTAEITSAFITAWFQRQSTAPLNGDSIANIIKDVYSAIHSLENDDDSK